MEEDVSKYWLAFASIEKIGSGFIKTVFDHFGSIKSAWCAGPNDLTTFCLNATKPTPMHV